MPSPLPLQRAFRGARGGASARPNVELSQTILPLVLIGALAWLGGFAPRVAAQTDDFELAPIEYSQSEPDNAASRLQRKLESGDINLTHEPHFGYLRSLLQALKVPESSQMLVFSKTSLQRNRISPQTPRSLYFSDDMYVGFCQGGDVLEISAVDDRLGAVFYTLDQTTDEPPRLTRQTDNCLICHGSSQTRGVPGHMVRSVFTDPRGFPILAAGTYRVDQATPLKNRWGGWYVTGKHGEQPHLGNLVVTTKRVVEPVDNSAGHNVAALGDRITTRNYLRGDSDIVALMVLEHQADAHNYLTRANFQCRQAEHYQTALNRDLKLAPDHAWDSVTSRVNAAAEDLVKYFLFSGETPLTAPIEGTSPFAAEFATQGPKDGQGRGLRDFDLQTRLFKHPCSYLIYSTAFDALPDRVRARVYERLWQVLSNEDQTAPYAHLTAQDRQNIREILLATKTGLPEYWK